MKYEITIIDTNELFGFRKIYQTISIGEDFDTHHFVQDDDTKVIYPLHRVWEIKRLDT